MVFLDASPIIYLVEQPPVWGPRATARLSAIRAAGELLVVTEIVRMECLVGPLKDGDMELLADFDTFFSGSGVSFVPITSDVALRAAMIRATYRFKPLDSLHLAAAVEHRCHRFQTNDTRLSRFPDIPIEILS